MQAVAQEDGQGSKVQVTGSIQSDILIPQADAKIGAEDYSEFALTNTFGEVNLSSKYIDAGARVEYLDHPLPGFEPDYKGWGLPYIYVKGKFKNVELTAGNFYEQFGSGFILRTYEERSLGIDNSLLGGRLVYKPFNWATVKVLGGKQRRYWHDGGPFEGLNDSWIAGGDVELNVEQWFKSMREGNTYLTLGASFVNKHEPEEELIATYDGTKRLNFPENVQIVMTGGKVWGEVSDNFTSTFTQNTGRGPYMWINWPCTDNSKKHLIMGGYSDFLQIGVNPDNIQGIVLNPMQQSEPSKVAIFGNACYSWNIWESQKEADKAWDASFACVDHNTVIPNDASNALRELSKHMINQAMDGRVRVLQESVELKPILNDFKDKLAAGTVTEQDVDAVMAEFLVLQEAAKTYRAKAGDQNLSEQIVYWINCWDDTTEAAIAYLNGVKAVLAGDTTNILKYNTEGKVAFDRSKTHEFWYIDHYEQAEVGVQHIVPFIKTLGNYVSQYAETAMDPSKVIANFITNRTDTPTGDVANIFDGSDSTGMTFKTPNAIAEGEYVGLLYNKVIDVNNIRITMQGQADHFEHSKLQYTTDGKEWVDIELREGENQFDVPRNQPFEISLDEDALPQDFQAMGVRLITTQANSGACWLDLREFQINAQDSEPEVTEGTYSTNRDRMNGTAWDVLNDGANGGASTSEVWLSVASISLTM